MGTKEQSTLADSATHNNAANATTNTTAAETATTTTSTMATSQVIIIPATQASTVATNAAKKIRRAFSMPRNPFRWSRKFKTSAAAADVDDASHVGGSNSALTACVGGGRGRTGSIVSLNSYDAVRIDANLQQQTSDGAELAVGKINAVVAGKQTSGNDETVANKNAQNVTNNNNNNNTGSQRVLRRSSFRKLINRIAQQVTSTVNFGVNKHASHPISTTDRVPPIGGYQWPADQTPGVTGLKNHGNTCFMNAVLQCLSHTDILAEYFVLDQYKVDLKRRNKINARKFGTKGELTEQLATVLKALWTCKNESDHSTGFKAVVDRYGSQFRSSTQHDAQEFLFWLLDKVHEDLNTATKKRYKSVKNCDGRPDEVIAAETLVNHLRCNNSFVQAVFQAQFRSSLTCPRCKKQSNTFDPFHCISVQLPQLTQQTIFVTVVYLKQQPRQVKLGLTVPAGSPIVALREKLQVDTGIASEQMVLVDINKEGFTRVFYDTQPIATLKGIDTIYCIEVPTAIKEQTTAVTAVAPATANTNAAAADNNKTAIAAVTANTNKSELLLLVANVHKKPKTPNAKTDVATAAADKQAEMVYERFGAPFCLQMPRDCSYAELQQKLLQEMQALLKPEVFAGTKALTELFQMRLQDPSADPDTYVEQVEHPLLTEMIDLALSVLSAEAGPAHIKLLLEWSEPEQYFVDTFDIIVEHESVARLLSNKPNDTVALTLEQCLEHYTKAETLSAEDAWRCPHCQQYLPVVKTLGLWSLPDILVVHFKRFRQHQEKGPQAAKLTTMVEFPLFAFDMAPHLARGVNEHGVCSLSATAAALSLAQQQQQQQYRPSPWKKTRQNDSRSSTLNSRADSKETRYDLYAVCYHQGETLETGHYTAACKNPYDRQWYKFDDQRVSKVPNDRIQQEIINNEAYMLFYQKRPSDAAESSGSSSSSGEHWVSRIVPPATATVVEKFASTAEQHTTAVGNIEAEAQIEKVPELAKSKPVDIPKVPAVIREEIELAADTIAATATAAPAPTTTTTTTSTSQEALTAVDAVAMPKHQQQQQQQQQTLAQMVVLNKINDKNLLNIEELDYVDAEEEKSLKQLQNDVAADDTVKQISTPIELNISETPTSIAQNAEDIFELEECVETTRMPSSSITAIAAEQTHAEKSSLLSSAANSAINGHCLSSTMTLNGHRTPNGSLSTTSSSTSSLSARSSSPHSLAVSANAANSLLNKFNNYATHATTTSSVHHYHHNHHHHVDHNAQNDTAALLSSSLKSESNSIIGIGAAVAANELARQQQLPWNGSRSSVSSAVEHATLQRAHHAHPGLNLRHSFSTTSNYKLRECTETLSSMLRNSANTCSKDTLIFIDQQNHHHHRHHHHHSLMEDDDDFMGSRSLWISPVTPHKLITVSPKN